MGQRSNHLCLVCSTPVKAAIRGQCRRCYYNARYAIEKGKTTEAELVERKLLLPRYAVPQSDFGSVLERILARRRRIQPCEKSA